MEPRYKVFFYEFQVNGRNILDVGFLAKTRSQAEKQARKVFKYLPAETRYKGEIAMNHIDKRGCLDDLETALEDAREGNICAIFDNNPDELVELLETGSVTLKTKVGTFVFTLGAWEEK